MVRLIMNRSLERTQPQLVSSVKYLFLSRSAHSRYAAHDYGFQLQCPDSFLSPRFRGMMVATKGVTEDEIEDFAAADPAVAAGLLLFEIRPWYTVMEHGT